MASICEGLTVVALGSGVACDLPTMVLADNGARVLKIERPGGDHLRTAAPSAFLVWNRGKESVVIDLATSGGRDAAQRLIARADVVVEAFGAGVADRLGVGAEAMRAANPALVYCSIKAFGSDGPYSQLKGYEGVVAAKAGGYGPAGFRAGPAFFGMPRASVAAGHHALQGVLAALVAREVTGRGQAVEVNLFVGLTTYDYFGTPVYQLVARHPERYDMRGGVVGRLGGMLCSADGRWVLPTNRLRKELEALVRVVGLEDVWRDPRFELCSAPGEAPRLANADDERALWDLIAAAFRARPIAPWLARMAAEDDLAAELVRTGEEGLDHPQVVHNGHAVEIDDPRAGVVRQVGPIALFTQTPSKIGRSAPALDEHGPLDAPRSVPLPADMGAAPPAHPLSDVTIIELGHHYAMPFAITLVAALGARVIKIEPPEGDHQRDLVPIPEAGAHKVMDGKESVIADVTTPEGRQIVYDLVRRADVFALGLRQPAADRMRMNEAAIRAANPDIVYFSATGYGDSGPFAGKAMHAGTASVAVGSLHHQASTWLDPAVAADKGLDELETIASHFGGAHNGDAAAAASAASALMLAILAKKRLGIAQYVRTTMLVGNAYSYSEDFTRYERKPPTPLTDPGQYGLGPLYRLYPTAAGWVFLAASSEREWLEFCAAAGIALGDDPRFATTEARTAHAEELAEELAAVFATRTAFEWEDALAPKGVACVKVYEGSASQFACVDAGVREAGYVVEVDHPIFGRFLRHGLPQRFSETPGRLGTGCWAGEHTHRVLAELGYSQEKISRLDAAGVTTVRRLQKAP